MDFRQAPLEADSLTSEDSQRLLGTHQEVLDGETAFARQMQLRQAAKEAFSFVDASQRLRASMLRKTTPTRGPFLAGNLVCFYRKGRSSHGRWYGPARVLGQEGRSTLWIIHGGVPMTVGIESLRHAAGNEVLAKHALELRPSRKRRREVLDPDEDEMDYPLADDLIGAPGIDNAEDIEQIPLFDLGTHAPEEPVLFFHKSPHSLLLWMDVIYMWMFQSLRNWTTTMMPWTTSLCHLA